MTFTCTSRSSSGGPPCPGSLNQATPSSTTPKNSSYMPAVGGAWKSNLNSYVPPGGTVPVTSAARLVETQVESAKTLARSRGCVVPRRVFESHVFVPVFFSVRVAATVWHVVTIIVVVAKGQLWLTYCAA